MMFVKKFFYFVKKNKHLVKRLMARSFFKFYILCKQFEIKNLYKHIQLDF